MGARQVIQEIDAALRALIRAEAFADRDVEVVFDAPTKEWAGRRNAPTVDVYLYDIREDMRRRARGVENEYDGNGRIIGRHLPPRHFKLSYLVTAWTQRPEDEHRLLSALLACFLRHDAIPAELLDRPRWPTSACRSRSRSACRRPRTAPFADVWSALGGELKPSLDVVVTAPTDTGQRRRWQTGRRAGRPDAQRRGRSIGGQGRRWPAGGATARPTAAPAAGPATAASDAECRTPAASPARAAVPAAPPERRHSDSPGLGHLFARVALVEARVAARWSSTGAATTPRPTTRSAGSTSPTTTSTGSSPRREPPGPTARRPERPRPSSRRRRRAGAVTGCARCQRAPG